MVRLLILSVVIIPVCAQGQVVHSFNSGGQHATTGSGLHVDAAFGEMFVKTYSTGQTTVQEGLLSGNLNIITSVGGPPGEASIKVYPTQFKNEFYIESKGAGDRYVIYNMTGQVIMQGHLTEAKTAVHLESPAQWHLLKIYVKNPHESHVFKIRRSD